MQVLIYFSNSYFLHVHGGVSHKEDFQLFRLGFSPCAWRCFQTHFRSHKSKNIFSMCMEVFLNGIVTKIWSKNFLHVHGGVSYYAGFDCCLGEFSPCAWRCFWYDASLFNGNPDFLHVHGGVSIFFDRIACFTTFSPCAWRCFSGNVLTLWF